MSNDESDLERHLEDEMERIESALDAANGDELPDEAAESARESADAVAEEVANASLGELLTASGFEHESDDVTPGDLPTLMQDADADTVLNLRHLLETADLSDEWSSLDADERLDRLERIGGDETAEDGSRSVSDLLASVFSLGGSDQGAAEAEDADRTSTDDGSEAKADGDFLSTEDAIEEFSSLFERIGGSDDDEGGDDETGAGGEDGDSGRERVTDMYSTMPSSRSDMGRRKRHSTVRGKE